MKQGETSVAARTENQIDLFSTGAVKNELHSLKLVIFAAENGWLELEYLHFLLGFGPISRGKLL